MGAGGSALEQVAAGDSVQEHIHLAMQPLLARAHLPGRQSLANGATESRKDERDSGSDVKSVRLAQRSEHLRADKPNSTLHKV